jgi:Tfp pilus assembly protein PilF
MHLFSRSNSFALLKRTVILTAILLPATISRAQSINGVNTTGNEGNEVIQGTIHFPVGHKPGFQPVVKLQSDSSSADLKALANPDGSFSFTRLRPDSYTVVVEGGAEFENAREHVQIGNSGPVPAQGNPFQYAIPLTYQLEIYLQPKRSTAFNLNSEATRTQLEKLSEPTRTLFQKAMVLAGSGESAKAINELQAALSQAPDFELAYTQIGLQYLKLGKPAEAAENLTSALKLDANDFEARLNLGFALVNLKKFREAEEQLRLVLKQDATSATGHYYLGLALMNQQEFDAAVAEFKTSISKSSDGIAAAHKYLGGIYWREKQFAPAAAELEKYLGMEPNAPDAARIRETVKELRAKR